jgi:hypothetical protein
VFIAKMQRKKTINIITQTKKSPVTQDATGDWI